MADSNTAQVKSSQSRRIVSRTSRQERLPPVSKNAVTYNDIDPVMMAVMMGNGVIHGAIQIPRENRLNDRYPEIVPMGIEELLTRAWLKQ
jgi:hypothetical protein